MSRKSQVKASIDAKIKQNGKQEITGPVLNGVLTSILDASLMDIKDAEGNTLPRDAEGNAILPQVASKSELDAEVTRAQAAEALIAELASSKLTRVDLACDGYEPLKITYRGQTEALTFAEIYGLVTDKSKFVTLLDSEMFILLPSLSIDGDAIEFAGINVMSHQAEAQRVIINQENLVSVYPIELEDSDRKVSSAESISGADAIIKYPNIKALKDYVSAHGGGLTPEQEAKLNAAITARAAGTGGVPALPFVTDAPSDGKQYARKDGAWEEVQGGGETPWTLKYEHTFVADEPTLRITDIGSNFLLLIDYNGTLAVAQNVLMEYGNNVIRVNNPFSANRQIHMSVELHNDGTITSVESTYSEWNNYEATNVKMVKRELAKFDYLSIYATNGKMPEGTILKLYTK